jgi:hypothetical protein
LNINKIKIKGALNNLKQSILHIEKIKKYVNNKSMLNYGLTNVIPFSDDLIENNITRPTISSKYSPFLAPFQSIENDIEIDEDEEYSNEENENDDFEKKLEKINLN